VVAAGALAVTVAVAGVAWSAVPRASVGSLQLKPRSVTAAKLAPNAVTSAAIRNGSVAAVDLRAGAVTGGKLAVGAVGASALANGAVTSSSLATGAVTSAAIADGAITSAKVAAGAIGAAHLAGAAVTTSALADGSVTAAKLAAVPRVELTRSATLALPDDVTTTITWDVETADPMGWHAPSSDVVTVDRAGIYLVEASVSVAHGADSGVRTLFLRGPGVTDFFASDTTVATPIASSDGAGSRDMLTVARSIRLDAGESVGADLVVDTDGAANGLGTSASLERFPSYPTPSFVVTWIGS
jgi:hypothetical protein